MKTNKFTLSPARKWFSLLAAVLILSKPTGVLGIAGLEGTFEFGLDAPWRLEPSKSATGSTGYGAIPIQITIHDAMNAHMDDILYATETVPGFPAPIPVSLQLPHSLVSLGKIYSIRVKELGPVARIPIEFPLQSLHEIEMTTVAKRVPAIGSALRA